MADQSIAAAWRERLAPGLDDIAALAEDAFARLPEAFRAPCAGVTFLVEEFPDADTLHALDLESEFDLLGLYHGVDIGAGDPVRTGGDKIILYRRPLLDYWAEHDETLGHLVTHVLVHEIGHHLGLSDDDMAAIEAAAG